MENPIIVYVFFILKISESFPHYLHCYIILYVFANTLTKYFKILIHEYNEIYISIIYIHYLIRLIHLIKSYSK